MILNTPLRIAIWLTIWISPIITQQDKNNFVHHFEQAYNEFGLKNFTVYLIPTLNTLSTVSDDELRNNNLSLNERRLRFLETIIRREVVLTTCEYALDLSSGRGYVNGRAWQGKYGWGEASEDNMYYSALADYLREKHFDYLFFIPEFGYGVSPVFWIICDGEVLALTYQKESKKYQAIAIDLYIMEVANDTCFYNLAEHAKEARNAYNRRH